MVIRLITIVPLLLACVGSFASAQAHAPLVTMSISLPEGRTQEFTVPEGGVATLKAADGREYGFRPTIQDSKPWTRLTVTIFTMATAKEPTEVLGDLEITTGAPAVATKTTPTFRVSVPKVTDPPSR